MPDRIAVVDFKLTGGEVGDNHRMQLAGYSLLAEAVYQRPAPVAFLFRIPDNRVFPIEITPDLRSAVAQAISAIHVMADRQICPPPTPVRGRCLESEFANYGADVWGPNLRRSTLPFSAISQTALFWRSTSSKNTCILLKLASSNRQRPDKKGTETSRQRIWP